MSKEADWMTAESAAEEKIIETQIVNYKIEEQRFSGDLVTAEKRRSKTATKGSFLEIDIDITNLINMQNATKTATVNALLRFAINTLNEKGERLDII